MTRTAAGLTPSPARYGRSRVRFVLVDAFCDDSRARIRLSQLPLTHEHTGGETRWTRRSGAGPSRAERLVRRDRWQPRRQNPDARGDAARTRKSERSRLRAHPRGHGGRKGRGSWRSSEPKQDRACVRRVSDGCVSTDAWGSMNSAAKLLHSRLQEGNHEQGACRLDIEKTGRSS